MEYDPVEVGILMFERDIDEKRAKKLIYSKKYYYEHREQYSNKFKAYYAEHKEERYSKTLAWRHKHTDRVAEYNQNYKERKGDKQNDRIQYRRSE